MSCRDWSELFYLFRKTNFKKACATHIQHPIPASHWPTVVCVLSTTDTGVMHGLLLTYTVTKCGQEHQAGRRSVVAGQPGQGVGWGEAAPAPGGGGGGKLQEIISLLEHSCSFEWMGCILANCGACTVNDWHRSDTWTTNDWYSCKLWTGAPGGQSRSTSRTMKGCNRS